MPLRWTSLSAVLIACWIFAPGAGAVSAQQPSPSAEGHTVVLLWPDGAPGAKGKSDADKPSLTVFLPNANPTRTGIIVAPGGGYEHLAMGYEGYDIARWLNAHGIAAFVLKYRIGPVYHHPIELGDAKRAIRTVRAHATEYGLASDHIGMMGFSAGGHLAATAATLFDPGDAKAADPIDRQGSRPDFLVLGYPVITMEDPEVHQGSRKFLLGDHPTAEEERLLSANLQVTGVTPPTFLVATTDDKVVPVLNSVMFYSALVRVGVPAEMHLFAHGNHGFGLAKNNPEVRVWPELMLHWLEGRGLAAPSKDQP